jgi:hypothetical protein
VNVPETPINRPGAGQTSGGSPGPGVSEPLLIPVPGIARDIQVKIASRRQEWEGAFQLVASRYRASGYESPGPGDLRFTPYYALPETVTFVAQHEDRVIATFSYVPDNRLLSMPLSRVFEPEINQLRESGRRLGEAASLADADLGLREFGQVFLTLIRLAMQCHAHQGGDTVVITVNPSHRNFYTRLLGFEPLGSCRAHPTVQGAPAEAFWLDWSMLRARAPAMYQRVFGEPLPAEALVGPAMPRHLVQYIASRSTQPCGPVVREVFDYVDSFGSPRLW